MPDFSSPTTPAMRLLLLVASILVLIIGLPMYLAPTRTDLLFSWTVNPPMTAAFLGSGYLAAFVIELSSAREASWERARISVPAVLVFTTMTLIATLLHLDKFHFGSEFPAITQFVTYVWLVVYALVPVIMAVLLLLQVRQIGTDRARIAPMPAWSQTIYFLQGLVLLLVGASLFFFPGAMKDMTWPWALSALTARAIGAWCLGNGVLFVHIAIERDYWRVKNALLALFIYATLLVVSFGRLADDLSASGERILDQTDPMLYAYLAFVISILIMTGHGWLKTSRVGPRT